MNTTIKALKDIDKIDKIALFLLFSKLDHAILYILAPWTPFLISFLDFFKPKSSDKYLTASIGDTLPAILPGFLQLIKTVDSENTIEAKNT